MYNIDLIRLVDNSKETYGILVDSTAPLCSTLELSYKDNKSNISSIPCGKYICERGISPSQNKKLGGKVFKVLNVPNRTDVLIHIGNTVKDTKGCILVGSQYGKDSLIDSTSAMIKLLEILPDRFELNIKEVK